MFLSLLMLEKDPWKAFCASRRAVGCNRPSHVIWESTSGSQVLSLSCFGDAMILSKHVIALFLLLGFTFNPSTATVAGSQMVQSSSLGGLWIGSLLQKEWTFEFTTEGGNWSGRYMPPGGVKWHPLSAPVISGRSVSFSMESKPKLSFALELDTVKPTMSGTVTIEGVATVPFSATRKS